MSPSAHRKPLTLIGEFFANRLALAGWRELFEHLTQCLRCAAIFEELRADWLRLEGRLPRDPRLTAREIAIATRLAFERLDTKARRKSD